MQIISVNVGLPRDVHWKGKLVSTGIFKEPVALRVVARRLNLDGDRQADLTVHGGPEKAIYAYPAEHYDYWRQELPRMALPWGMFGENLTTWGLLEGRAVRFVLRGGRGGRGWGGRYDRACPPRCARHHGGGYRALVSPRAA